MEYIRLGATGLKVSRICLGCLSFGSQQSWMLSEEESQAVIQRAIEGGINFFDTANVYSYGESEQILGRALRAFGAARDEMVIATKLFFPMSQGPNDGGLSRKHIMHSIDESLMRLGMDHVDLLQIHRFDEGTPIEETLEALHDVVRAGKARYLGACTMAAWQLAKLLWTADLKGLTRFVSMQNNYSLLYREQEREMIPLCIDQGVGVIPYSPLAQGLLAGSRAAGTLRSKSALVEGRFARDADAAVVAATAEVAAARGVAPAQVAIAWLLSRPGVVAPIVGITRVEQLRDPLDAIGFELSPAEIARLEGAYVTQPQLPVFAAAIPTAPVRRTSNITA